jgi:hypothetical protein
VFVNLTLQDIIVISTALIAAIGSAYFYVVGTLDQDRSLSRSAALAFFVFSLVAAVFFLRAL